MSKGIYFFIGFQKVSIIIWRFDIIK